VGSKNGPETLWRYYDELYAQHKKSLLLTELDIGISDANDPEQLAYQADRLRDTLTIAFAHPAIGGITQWGFWEGQHWVPSAALWRRDWTIKPIGQAYVDLLTKTWRTDKTEPAKRDGVAKLRGFQGDYQVTVSAGGKTKTVPATIGSGATQITVSLP
jgi:hypothetical protein